MTRSIIRSFPVNGEKMLRFENLAGRVELVPGNGPTVEVAAIVRVSELAEGDVKRLIDDIRWVEAPAEDGDSRWGLALPEGRYPTVRYPVSGESPPGVTTVSHLGREIRLSDRPGASIPAVEFDLRIAVPPRRDWRSITPSGPSSARILSRRCKRPLTPGAFNFGTSGRP